MQSGLNFNSLSMQLLEATSECLTSKIQVQTPYMMHPNVARYQKEIRENGKNTQLNEKD